MQNFWNVKKNSFFAKSVEYNKKAYFQKKISLKKHLYWMITYHPGLEKTLTIICFVSNACASARRNPKQTIYYKQFHTYMLHDWPQTSLVSGIFCWYLMHSLVKCEYSLALVCDWCRGKELCTNDHPITCFILINID
jgi:hypothetical protein